LHKKNEQRKEISKKPLQKNQKIRKVKEQKRLEAEARQNISKERNRIKKEIDKLETKIDSLEKEKTQIEKEMSNPDYYRDQENSAMTGRRYQVLQQIIPELVSEWESMQTEYADILAKLKPN
jgi:ATP-binding cassette subfamily F protein 3